MMSSEQIQIGESKFKEGSEGVLSFSGAAGL